MSLLSVNRPDVADGFFLIESFGSGGAFGVGVIPALAIQRRAQGAAAGHFQMAGRIGLADPAPRVMQPLVAIFLALLREPGDLVVAPDPDATGFCLPGLTTGAEVVDLHQIGKMIALPAAERDPAFAPAVDAVGKSNFQHR